MTAWIGTRKPRRQGILARHAITSAAPLGLLVGFATFAGADASRDHDEMPRVIACQERLMAAAEALRAAMPGYDFALEIRAAERPLIAKGVEPVTCALRQTDNVPALTQYGIHN